MPDVVRRISEAGVWLRQPCGDNMLDLLDAIAAADDQRVRLPWDLAADIRLAFDRMCLRESLRYDVEPAFVRVERRVVARRLRSWGW